MVVLITGATGLLGRHVIAELKKAEEETLVIVRGPGTQKIPGVQMVWGDLSQPGFSANIPKSVTTIVHLAQSANYREFPNAAKEVFRVNVQATQELLEFGQAVGIERFVYASSGGVYEAGSSSVTEEGPIRGPKDLDFYLSTKLSSELFTQSYRAFFDHTILRFFFIYGPGQKRQMFLPRLFDSVFNGRKIHLTGRDGVVVNPVHASDAARAVRAAMNLEGSETINVGGPESYSLREIADLLGQYVGREPNFVVEDGGDEHRLVANITKMKKLLVSPTITVRDSLADLELTNPV